MMESGHTHTRSKLKRRERERDRQKREDRVSQRLRDKAHSSYTVIRSKCEFGILERKEFNCDSISHAPQILRESSQLHATQALCRLSALSALVCFVSSSKKQKDQV